jgi:hypothetical protein
LGGLVARPRIPEHFVLDLYCPPVTVSDLKQLDLFLSICVECESKPLASAVLRAQLLASWAFVGQDGPRWRKHQGGGESKAVQRKRYVVAVTYPTGSTLTLHL